MKLHQKPRSNAFVATLILLVVLTGCASRAPQNMVDASVTTHISHGVKVYNSRKNQEVRAALLDNKLHLLTRNSLYLSIDNRSTEPVAFTLQNLSLQRGGKNLHLIPLAELIEHQEKLSEEALSESKLPKIFSELRKETTSGNGARSEIKKATAEAIKTPIVPSSQDPFLDELLKEQLLNPRDAENAEQVKEAHKKVVASLSKNYVQPVQLAPGQKMAGFIKFAQDLAPTNVPLLFKVTIGNESSVFVIDPL